MGLAFVVISARLVEVLGFKAGDNRFAHVSAPTRVETSRADIVDRNGVLLATNIAHDTVRYARSQDHRRRAYRHAQRGR